MSETKEALARAQYQRWNAKDFDAWIEGFDPDVQSFSSVSAGLDGEGEFHGHEGLNAFVEAYFEAWEWFQLWPMESSWPGTTSSPAARRGAGDVRVAS